MAKKRGVKKGTKRGPYKKATGVDINQFLSPASLQMSAVEIKASLRQLNMKLKAINSLLRALKKEGK